MLALSFGCDQAQRGHEVGTHASIRSPRRIAEKLGCEGETLGWGSESQSVWMGWSKYVSRLVEWDDAAGARGTLV